MGGILAALLAALPGETAAQTGSGGWRPDDRILITDFSSVRALARGFNEVFAATSGGLVMFDDQTGNFEPPVTLEDGYPRSPVTALGYDEQSASVWMATLDGQMLQLDPYDRRFRERFSVSEPIVQIVGTGLQERGLLVRTRRGWRRLDLFTREMTPVPVAVARDAIERSPDLRARRELLADPAFQAIAGFLGGTTRAGRVPVTDVMPAWRSGVFWVGTDGAFLVRYDHFQRTSEPVSYGLVGEGVAAMLSGRDGLWFAPQHSRRGRYALSRSDPGLERWTEWDADSLPAAPRTNVRALLRSAGVVWAGGRDGLSRYDETTGEWARVGLPGGVSARDILSLAASEGSGIWVGTRRGAVRLTGPEGIADRMAFAGRRITALLERDGTVWAGTPRGLFRLELGEGGRESLVTASAALSDPIGALVATGSEILAGAGAEVWRRSAVGSWKRVGALGRFGGRVTALAVRNGKIWAGSSEGVVGWDPAGGPLARWSFAAGDLPAGPGGRAVYALLPEGDRFVWVGTPAGALRVDAGY